MKGRVGAGLEKHDGGGSGTLIEQIVKETTQPGVDRSVLCHVALAVEESGRAVPAQAQQLMIGTQAQPRPPSRSRQLMDQSPADGEEEEEEDGKEYEEQVTPASARA
jgi:hypothetical protein